MTETAYRPVKKLCFGLILAGGVGFCLALFMLLAGLKLGSVAVWVTLATAGLLLVLGGIGDTRGSRMVVSTRQAGMSFISLGMVLLAVVALILVCYISQRHGMKFDWTEKNLWTLTPRVKDIVGNLDRKVEAAVLFVPREWMPGQPSPDYEILDLTKRILDQFADGSENFSYELVDLMRSPQAWEGVQRKFGVQETDLPCVVFSSEGRKEVVRFDSIYALESTAGAAGGWRKSYKGESRFASAILTLQGRVMPVVYFTVGHGEQTLDRGPMGIAAIADQLRANYVDVRECPDLTKNPVPEDCAALMIIGVQSPFAREEVLHIGEYLDQRKGSLYVGVAPMVMDPKDQHVHALVDTGLESLLGGYGIVLDNDLVVEDGLSSVSVSPQTWHAIAQGMGKTRVVLRESRSIQMLPAAPSSTGRDPEPALPLLLTSEAAYGETDFRQVLEDRVSEFDEGVDIRRPKGLALAVVLERYPLRPAYDPVATNEETQPTRVVVVGNVSYMLPVGTPMGVLPAPYGNMDFFMRCVKWLVRTTDLVQVEPLNLDVRMMDKLAQDTEVSSGPFWLLVVGLPLVVILTGLVVWLFRRT